MSRKSRWGLHAVRVGGEYARVTLTNDDHRHPLPVARITKLKLPNHFFARTNVHLVDERDESRVGCLQFAQNGSREKEAIEKRQ